MERSNLTSSSTELRAACRHLITSIPMIQVPHSLSTGFASAISNGFLDSYHVILFLPLHLPIYAMFDAL